MYLFSQIDHIFLLLLISIVIASTLAWISIRMAPMIELMDVPGSADHKSHHDSMPVVGGIVLLDTLILIVIIFGQWTDNTILGILVSSIVIGLFGLWDDYKNLKVELKLLGQILGAMVLISFGVHVNFFGSPEFLIQIDMELAHWLNILVTILWLVTLTNAFNFIDSFDGIAAGLTTLSSTFFLIISVGTGQQSMIFLCTIMLGTSTTLYYLNSHPAKLFLGDSGSQSIGFFLAAIAILYQPLEGNQASTWFIPVLIFSVPLFDLCLVVASRLRRGKKIHKASRDHTYHRLEDSGFSMTRSVLIMHGISLLLSMVGYLCINLPYIIANVVFGLVLLLGILAFFELDKNYH